jgi:hypothetical protein
MDGLILSLEWKETLWDKFAAAAQEIDTRQNKSAVRAHTLS